MMGYSLEIPNYGLIKIWHQLLKISDDFFFVGVVQKQPDLFRVAEYVAVLYHHIQKKPPQFALGGFLLIQFRISK